RSDLGVIPTYPKYEGVAIITLANTGAEFGLPDGTTGQYNNTYQITDNFSKVTGKHTLKFGGDIRYIQVNERNTYTRTAGSSSMEARPETTSLIFYWERQTSSIKRACNFWTREQGISVCMGRTLTRQGPTSP